MTDNSFRLDRKAAIVVGAALGIGRAIALAFADAGAKVACLDIDETAASETAAHIKSANGTAMAHRCDVTSEASIADAVKAVIAAHGGPRVLVNGAAMREPTGTIVELEPVDWNRAIAINLTGAYLMSRAIIPHMANAGGGSIVHIASQMGRVGAAGRSVYCATKGALTAREGDGRRPRPRQHPRQHLVAWRHRDRTRLVPIRQHGGRSHPGDPEAPDRPSRPA